MPSRLAVLHIGVPKTGSTSLQAWLAERRDELADRGFLVPRSLGEPHQIGLKKLAGRWANRDAGSRFASALRAELAAAPAGVHTVVLSNENVSTGFREAADLRTLKALLDQFCDGYRIVVYLRRQLEQRLSNLSTELRRGRGLPADPLGAPPYDYATLLALWVEVFGRAAVQPRLFEPDQLVGGDVVADFAALLGVPDLPGLAVAPQRNISLAAAAQVTLGRLAEAVRGNAADDALLLTRVPAWRALVTLFDERFAGPGLLPERDAAIAYLERCRESNEAVQAEWFPNRPTLFGGTFDRYPVAAPPPDPAALAATATAAAAFLLRRALPAAGGEALAGAAKPTAGRERRQAARRRRRAA